MVLQPLELADCQKDSPQFRSYLKTHEEAADEINDLIKNLLKQAKQSSDTCRSYSKAHRNFAQVLQEFNFERVGDVGTEDEVEIEGALSRFGTKLMELEDHREFMLEQANLVLTEPLETFRQVELGGMKEQKKAWDKESERFYGLLDKTLSLGAKKKDSVFMDADAQLEQERQALHGTSLAYVQKLTELQEKKKFEFVEKILAYMLGQMSFFHMAYESLKEMEPYITQLSLKLQNTRETFNTERELVGELMQKMINKGRVAENVNPQAASVEGYLMIQEKRKGGLGHTWGRHYCKYVRDDKRLTVLNASQGKLLPPEFYDVYTCTVCVPEVIDRRFCFEITSGDKLIVLQAMGQRDMDHWVACMTEGAMIPSRDGMGTPTIDRKKDVDVGGLIGIPFVDKCIQIIESRGLHHEGLYRLPGVQSKVNKLVTLGLENKPIIDDDDLDIKTLCSALKQYFRQLKKPLMTFEFHDELMFAIRIEDRTQRLMTLHSLLHRLPKDNFDVLKKVMAHLKRVSDNAEENKMLPSNLGVCFGPTLMRSKEESMAAIMNIKYQNYIVETLIEEYGYFFETAQCDTAGAQPTQSHAQSSPVAPAASGASSEDDDAQQRPQAPGHAPTTTTGHSQAPPRRPAPPSSKPPAPPPKKVRPISSTLAALPTLPTTHDHPPPRAAQQSAAVAPESPPPAISGGSGGSQASAPVVPTGKPIAVRRTVPLPAAPSTQKSGGGATDSAPQSPTPATAHSAADSAPPSRPGIPQRPMPPSRPVAAAAAAFSQPRKSTEDVKKEPPSRPKAAPRVWPPPAQSSSLGDEDTPGLVKESKGLAAEKPLPARPRSPAPPARPKPPTGGGGGPAGKRAVALYDCDGDDDTELSFSLNTTLVDVRESEEPGWLEGTIEGTTTRGLFPANYVRYL
eukprot:Opistho-2@15488